MSTHPFDRDALDRATEELARSFGIATARQMFESLARIRAVVAGCVFARNNRGLGEAYAYYPEVTEPLAALTADDYRLIGMAEPAPPPPHLGT